MAERVVLRSLLYLVFGWSFLAIFASMTRPGGSPGEPALVAFIALCALAVSAYDPRYGPLVYPMDEPRMKTPRPPEGKAGAAENDRGWLTRRD